MELKEIEERIEAIYGTKNKVANKLVMDIIQAYGQSQYNAALDEAAESATVKYVFGPDVWQIDKQSILNLKIPTK